MQAKYFTSAVAAVALSSSTCALASQAMNADYNNSEHQWMPKHPVDSYWQAPNYNFPSPGRAAPPAYTSPQSAPPVNNNAYRPPLHLLQ